MADRKGTDPGTRKRFSRAAHTGRHADANVTATQTPRRSAESGRSRRGRTSDSSYPNVTVEQPMSGAESRARERAKKQSDRREAKMAAKEEKRREKRASKEAKGPGFVKRTVNGWLDRLLGAAKDGGLGKQDAAYEGHRTTADYIWNSVGLGVWGMVFPVLTMVVTQLTDADQAGRFSLAFVTANLLVVIANYGMRTYQVSDVKEVRSFADYQAARWVTCICMMLIGNIYCHIRGYEGAMITVFMWVFTYKAFDGLADVYEGRLQQMDKLYLAGVSQTMRSAVAFLACTVVLLITRDVATASVALAIGCALSVLVVTIPLALLETPKSRRMSFASVLSLFKDGFPVFLALFLYQFIDAMPKFVMEGVLGYENQLYFNALYFPAEMILMIVGFIYKPMLGRIAESWADPSRRKRFDLFVIAMILIIAAVTAIAIGIMSWIGIPLLSLLYGIDFEQFRTMAYIMLVAGGLIGTIDFLYQVITVMRHQRDVLRLYIVTFGFALFVPYLMVTTAGLNGAIDGYLIVMAILLVLLVMQYCSVRYSYAKHPEKDPDYIPGSPLEARQTRPVHRSVAAQQDIHRRRSPRPSVKDEVQAKDVMQAAAKNTREGAQAVIQKTAQAVESLLDNSEGEETAQSVPPAQNVRPAQAAGAAGGEESPASDAIEADSFDTLAEPSLAGIPDVDAVADDADIHDASAKDDRG